MPNFVSMDAFSRELGKMNAEIERRKRKEITGPMAQEAQKIAAVEVSRDLGGDIKFSGWAPALVTQVKFTSTGAAVVHPTRTSAGPFTVAESGRNQGNAAGFSGPGVNRRTGATSRTKSGGIRKQRARGAKRWNGVTRGCGTSSRAVAVMEKKMPKVAEDGVRKVMVRHFDVT